MNIDNLKVEPLVIQKKVRVRNDYTLSVKKGLYVLEIRYRDVLGKVDRLEFNKSYIISNLDKINERYKINLILEMFV